MVKFAEDVNYWKSGKSAPDSWLDKAENQIIKVGGLMLGRASAFDNITGVEAYMLSFEIGDDRFKIVWPVLKCKDENKPGNKMAARRQAATMLYHDVKAKCMIAQIFGMRKAFIPYLVLESGGTVVDMSTYELSISIPQLVSNVESG